MLNFKGKSNHATGNTAAVPERHRNKDVVNMTKILVTGHKNAIKLTTSGSASAENFIKMMSFPFQWLRTQLKAAQYAITKVFAVKLPSSE